MTAADELIAAVVDAMRECTALIDDELEGEPSNIIPFSEVFPDAPTLLTAVYNAPRPSILVTYDGLFPGEDAYNEVEKHRIVLYLRCREGVLFGCQAMYQKMIEAPMTDGNIFRYYTIHPNCFPLEKPRLERVAHVSEPDFWKATFYLTEIGG